MKKTSAQFPKIKYGVEKCHAIVDYKTFEKVLPSKKQIEIVHTIYGDRNLILNSAVKEENWQAIAFLFDDEGLIVLFPEIDNASGHTILGAALWKYV